MSSERDFHHESFQDRRTIVAYLRELTEGFEKGTLTFSDNRGEITLEPQGLVSLEIHAARKRDRVSIAIKLNCQDGAATSQEDPGPLYINGSVD